MSKNAVVNDKVYHDTSFELTLHVEEFMLICFFVLLKNVFVWLLTMEVDYDRCHIPACMGVPIASHFDYMFCLIAMW